jgi:predicted metal-dependent hydrolase
MQNTFEYGSKRISFSEEGAGNSPGSEQLQRLCDSVLRASSPVFRDAAVEAEFYPYLGLTHTLRRKQDTWILRISDHCRSAPANVIEAIVRILACRVMRRKPPRKAMEIYELFRRDPEIADVVRRRRAAKGRKQFSGKPGKFHSLRNIYRELNDRYFNNQIEVKRIGWGLRKGRDRLGHYDPVHNTITLSPLLDSPDVPPFVVRYIVYHEMLHALFGDARADGAGKHHPREFRRTESAYPDYARAKKFLADFSLRQGRPS